MKNIIIIETSDVGAKHTAEAVISLGYNPIFICTLSNYQSDTLSQILNYTHFDCSDTTQLMPIVKVIEHNKIENIVGVITMLDSRLTVSYDLASYFEVPGVDKALKILCDKDKVATLIPEYSPQTFIFSKDQIPLADLQKLLSIYGKLILKPTRSAGALGMFIVSSLKELESLPSLINNISIEKLINGTWIAQPFIPGRLFSLEGYVTNKNVKFIGFTARQKIENTESVNHFPADDLIEINAKNKAYEAINELVRRSNYANGYFHTEFIVDKNNCYLIDANFGRIGGGGIAQQIAISFNKQPTDIYRHIIDLVLFRSTTSKTDLYETKPLRTLSINYGVPENATLKNITFPSHIPSSLYHTQLLNIGTLVPKMGINNWSWLSITVGYPHQLLSYLESIEITTDKDTIKPFYLKEGLKEVEKLGEYIPANIRPNENDNTPTLTKLTLS